MSLKRKLKVQSIIEYIVVLAAIVGFIVAGTLGLRRGIKSGLDAAEKKIQADLNNREYIGQSNQFDSEGRPLDSAGE